MVLTGLSARVGLWVEVLFYLGADDSGNVMFASGSVMVEGYMSFLDILLHPSKHIYIGSLSPANCWE